MEKYRQTESRVISIYRLKTGRVPNKLINMGFKEGNQYGKMSKRGEGKINKEVKSKLTDLMDNIIEDIDVEMLTTNQKFKLLDMCLQYSIPKMVYKAEMRQAETPKDITVTVVDSTVKK